MSDVIVHINDQAIVATGELLEEVLQRQAEAEADRVKREIEAAEKAVKKAELLAKLGITEDDAKLLLS